MVSKCCNPCCDAVFRYLYEGRVFVLENDRVAGAEPSNRPEYFWLCRTCSTRMTLRLGEDSTVVAMLLRDEVQYRPDGVLRHLEDRKAGLRLRNILFPEHHRVRRKIAQFAA